MRKIFEVFSFQIIISISMTMFISGFAILFNDQIRGFYWIIAMLLAIGYSFISFKGEKKRIILLTNILFLGITFSAFFVSHYFYDTSWDGQTYHQESVIELKEGWNPLYDGHLDEEIIENVWINHYAKGNWYYAATIYDLFNDLEIGKSFNVLLMTSLFALAFSFLLAKTKWYWSIFGATVITLNPVAVNQAFSNYNDGQIGVIMSIMVLLLLIYHQTNKLHYYRLIGLLLVVMASIKFTALAYAMLLAAMPFVYQLSKYIFVEKKRNIKELIMNLLKMKELSIFIVALFVGVGIIGAASYVTNTMDHKHPFYPLSGEGKIDIMSYNTPKSIEEKPLYQQFYISAFGELTNNRQAEEVAIKFPLTITEKEQDYLASVDLRIGGFGPYFGFIIILTGMFAVAWRQSIFREANIVELIILVLILLSILINPELWWARYIPQIWLIPLLVLWMVMKEKTKIKRIWLFAMVAVMILNSGAMMLASVGKNLTETAARNEQLTMLKQYAKKNELIIQYDTMRSNRILFHNFQNIKKEEVQAKVSCRNSIGVAASTTRVCILNEEDYKEMMEANKEIMEKYAKEDTREIKKTN